MSGDSVFPPGVDMDVSIDYSNFSRVEHRAIEKYLKALEQSLHDRLHEVQLLGDKTAVKRGIKLVRTLQRRHLEGFYRCRQDTAIEQLAAEQPTLFEDRLKRRSS